MLQICPYIIYWIRQWLLGFVAYKKGGKLKTTNKNQQNMLNSFVWPMQHFKYDSYGTMPS